MRQEFAEIALFIKVMMEYDESKKPGEKSARRLKALEEQIEKITYKSDKEYVPEGYKVLKRFGDLGNSRYRSSFIAVVYIEGNAMGKRVEQIRKEYDEKPGNSYGRVKIRLTGLKILDQEAFYNNFSLLSFASLTYLIIETNIKTKSLRSYYVEIKK